MLRGKKKGHKRRVKANLNYSHIIRYFFYSYTFTRTKRRRIENSVTNVVRIFSLIYTPSIYYAYTKGNNDVFFSHCSAIQLITLHTAALGSISYCASRLEQNLRVRLLRVVIDTSLHTSRISSRAHSGLQYKAHMRSAASQNLRISLQMTFL
jgi:hypothetical protein